MKYTLKVTETKNKAGKFHYQVIDENGQLISERKSNRVYVACTRNGGFYFGRLDLVGRGDHGRMIKNLYVQLAQTKLTDHQVKSNESAIARGDVPFYSIEKINADAKAYLETYEAIATIAPVVAEVAPVVAPKADPIQVGDTVLIEDPKHLFNGRLGVVTECDGLLPQALQLSLVHDGSERCVLAMRRYCSKVNSTSDPIEEIEAIPASERMNLGPHTPGPWDAMIGGSIVTDDALVAEVRFNHFDGPTSRANARLIAAAPDLLEALRAARSLIKSTGVTEDSRIGGNILKEINEAIKKATL